MRFRYLRYFLEVAEEGNFTRAASKVNIEASPLSRAIKELESQLGVQLLYRAKGRIQLTWAGEVFRDEAQRILAFVESAQARVKAAEQGYRGQLRIGLCDGLAQPNLTRLLARSREEEPRTEIRIVEMPLSKMLKAIKLDQLDAGFTIDNDSVDGCFTTPVWAEQPAFAIPARHPILTFDRVPLSEATRYPLIMCHPERCASGHKTIQRWLRDSQQDALIVAQHVSSHEPMMMLVAAGYGIGIGLATQVNLFNHPDVISRPILDEGLEVTTFIAASSQRQVPQELERFTRRAQEIGGIFADN
ncbi:LysR family transcriptional regulator [Shinella sp.]|uniref:LysR family transcriptional regulator n=1 Tax=Shinella sp. TaxID=1870904 RepID=UPI0025895720|nr:LysR family transcriptional regulator [Shinella sp.]MCW5706904.1 LysR family transcriptional regulator [Shinella sp.]